MDLQVKKITKKFMEQVLQIQSLCYRADLIEEPSVFQSIMQIFSDGALGLFARDQMIGYLFFLPFYKNRLKPLNSEIALTGTEDCIYIHDLAIHPDYRRSNAGKQMVEACKFFAKNHGFPTISLVAVQGSEKFWEKQGFTEIQRIEYGDYPAIYMQYPNLL